jgi:hypothetical protein
MTAAGGRRIRVVPGAGLYADGYAGRARRVVDDDRGYLLGVIFDGPGAEELINPATLVRGRPLSDQPALARRPMFPTHQRSLAPPARGLPVLSWALAVRPCRAAVGCLSERAVVSAPGQPSCRQGSRRACVRLRQLDDVNAL